MLKFLPVLFLAAFLLSCSATNKDFRADRKFSGNELKEDYRIFRSVLEELHPSLYWYTSKDSMDYFFNREGRLIGDSLTEPAFRTMLMYVISKINCGHTAVKYSKQYSRYLDTAKLRTFPLGLKFWQDTMVVTANLNRRDSLLTKGTVLKSINGYNPSQLRDSLFNFVVTDGYSLCGKYQTLSTGFVFANLYKNIIGITDSFQIRYLDSIR